MEGWLEKKSSASTRFDKRYFVLAGHDLLWYSKPPVTGGELRGSLNLALIAVSRDTRGVTFTVQPHSALLKENDELKDYVFKCDLEPQAKRWRKAIFDVSERCRSACLSLFASTTNGAADSSVLSKLRLLIPWSMADELYQKTATHKRKRFVALQRSQQRLLWLPHRIPQMAVEAQLLAEAKGSILLDGAELSVYDQRKHAFVVSQPTQQAIFFCTSQEELQKWMTAVQSSINFSPNEQDLLLMEAEVAMLKGAEGKKVATRRSRSNSLRASETPSVPGASSSGSSSSVAGRINGSLIVNGKDRDVRLTEDMFAWFVSKASKSGSKHKSLADTLIGAVALSALSVEEHKSKSMIVLTAHLADGYSPFRVELESNKAETLETWLNALRLAVARAHRFHRLTGTIEENDDAGKEGKEGGDGAFSEGSDDKTEGWMRVNSQARYCLLKPEGSLIIKADPGDTLNAKTTKSVVLKNATVTTSLSEDALSFCCCLFDNDSLLLISFVCASTIERDQWLNGMRKVATAATTHAAAPAVVGQLHLKHGPTVNAPRTNTNKDSSNASGDGYSSNSAVLAFRRRTTVAQTQRRRSTLHANKRTAGRAELSLRLTISTPSHNLSSSSSSNSQLPRSASIRRPALPLKRFFDAFLVIGKAKGVTAAAASILHQYPAKASLPAGVADLPRFCFPTDNEEENDAELPEPVPFLTSISGAAEATGGGGASDDDTQVMSDGSYVVALKLSSCLCYAFAVRRPTAFSLALETLQFIASSELGADDPASHEEVREKLHSLYAQSVPALNENDDDEALSKMALGTLFKLVPLPLLEQVFSAVLTERSIVVYAEKVSVVSALCMSLSILLRPLAWQGALIPILPEILRDALYCPVPFIIGTVTPLSDEERSELDCFVLSPASFKFCRDSVEVPLPELPNLQYLQRQLVDPCNRLVNAAQKVIDDPFTHSESEVKDVFAVQSHLRDYVQHMLSLIQSMVMICTANGIEIDFSNPKSIELFLVELNDPEYDTFLGHCLATMAFNAELCETEQK